MGPQKNLCPTDHCLEPKQFRPRLGKQLDQLRCPQNIKERNLAHFLPKPKLHPVEEALQLLFIGLAQFHERTRQCLIRLDVAGSSAAEDARITELVSLHMAVV